MILCITDVLDEKALAEIRQRLSRARYVDGGSTAGWSARGVKNNLQMDGADENYRAIIGLLEQALAANDIFAMAALPRSLSRPLISRSDIGMGYGAHVDNAVMGDPPLRTDLAYTLFLSAPESYDGGALVIEDAEGEQSFKLPAGALVLYPATTLHRVETVTRGVRHVIAGWVQSLVRDPRVREILFDLDRARRAHFQQHGKSAEFDLFSKSYSNLLRLYAET
jgi:PKHD-type hydroxylase